MTGGDDVALLWYFCERNAVDDDGQALRLSQSWNWRNPCPTTENQRMRVRSVSLSSRHECKLKTCCCHHNWVCSVTPSPFVDLSLLAFILPTQSFPSSPSLHDAIVSLLPVPRVLCAISRLALSGVFCDN